MNASQFKVEAAEKATGSGIDSGGVSHMPFPRDGGEVAGLAKDLRDGVAVFVQGAPVTGDTLVGGHPAYSGLMRVESGQERGPGGAAASGIIKLGELRATLGEGIEVRGGNLTAIGPDIGKPHIVHHDEDNVGTLVCCEEERKA